MFNCPICAEDKAASGSIDLLLSVKGSPTPQTPHPHLSPQSVWCWLQRPGYMELLKSLTSSCVWRRLTDDCPFHWFTITCFVQTSRSPPSTLQRVAIFSVMKPEMETRRSEGGKTRGWIRTREQSRYLVFRLFNFICSNLNMDIDLSV